MRTPTLMTEQRKRALGAIDAAIKLEQIKAAYAQRPLPTAISINGAPASAMSITRNPVYQKTPKGVVPS
jgi:hypothetical protein